jgi:hypothetical protein
MTSAGTKLVTETEVGNPLTSPAAHNSLEEVLTMAERCQTDPFCGNFGPLPMLEMKNRSRMAYSALVTAQDESGRVLAAWLSEPMFSTPEAATEHAEDVIGTEIWPLFSCCGGMD